MRQLYLEGQLQIGNGGLDWLTDTIFVALIDASALFDTSMENFDEVVAAEINASNYVGGHAGAGRKILTSKTVVKDLTNGRIAYTASIPLWTTLGNGVNDTIAAAVVAKQGSSDDTDATLIGFWDEPFPLLTSGENLRLIHQPEGFWFHTPG